MNHQLQILRLSYKREYWTSQRYQVNASVAGIRARASTRGGPSVRVQTGDRRSLPGSLRVQKRLPSGPCWVDSGPECQSGKGVATARGSSGPGDRSFIISQGLERPRRELRMTFNQRKSLGILWSPSEWLGGDLECLIRVESGSFKRSCWLAPSTSQGKALLTEIIV